MTYSAEVTAEMAVARINAEGLIVRSCFQVHRQLWSASLRSRDGRFAAAEGGVLSEALQRAFARALDLDLIAPPSPREPTIDELLG